MRQNQTSSVRPHQHRHFTVSKWSPTSTRPRRRSNCTALESTGTNLQSTHSCTSPSPKLDSASRLWHPEPDDPSPSVPQCLALAFASPSARLSAPQTTVAETTCHIQHTRTATETRFDLAACPLRSPPCTTPLQHWQQSSGHLQVCLQILQSAGPCLVELLSEQWHQQCRVLSDAKQTQ